MDEAEFDKFADEYREIHEDNIRLSGEGPGPDHGIARLLHSGTP